MPTANFSYTGATQTYTVPDGCTQITVSVAGAQGGAGGPAPNLPGGAGGSVQATLAVTSGDAITVYVGGEGATSATNAGAAGGWGWSVGGAGGTGSSAADPGMGGGGGGGASALVDSAGAVLTVGAGGGGAGGKATPGAQASSGAAGGAGGDPGTPGADAPVAFSGTLPGGGGSAANGPGGAPGTGATGGVAGSGSTAGAGGAANQSTDYVGGGGGGGGGYLAGSGGGGAGTLAGGGGGGGGNNYVAAGAAAVIETTGTVSGAGTVSITNNAPAAPTLTAPAPASYDAPPVTLAWTYNPTDPSNTQTGWAVRFKSTAATTYSYWNASTSAFQSTVVWNTGAGLSLTLSSTATATGTSYQFSAATQDQGGQGPFATDATFAVAYAPTVTVTSPGPITPSSTFDVEWGAAAGAGSSLTGIQVGAWYYADFFDGGAPFYTSGSLPPSATSVQVVGASYAGFQNGVAVVIAVEAFQQGGQTGTAFVSTTMSYDVPATPTVSAVPGEDPTTGCPLVRIAVQCHDNLLATDDASFEGGIGTWASVTNADLTQSSAWAADGTSSLSIQPVATGEVQAAPVSVDVAPGSAYTLWSVWRAESAPETVTTAVRWYDSGGTLLSTDSLPSATDSASANTVVSGAVTAPSTAATADVLATVAAAAGPLAAPAAPTVTPTGTAGTTTYDYVITAVDAYGETTASPTGSTTTGNATLTSTDYNALSWTAVTGASSYNVYGRSGTTLNLLGNTTGTTFDDTGQGLGSATPPTTNTTAERHYLDEVGLFPGSVTEWTRGGLVGLTTVQILRSDQLYVRGASPAAPATVPTLLQRLTVDDYEAVPSTPYSYAVVVVATVSTIAITSATANTSSVTLLTTKWWELDPTDPSTAVSAQIVDFNPQVTEQSTAHLVMGQAVPNVVANTMGKTDGAATFETFDVASYNGLQSLLASQRTIFLSDPFGDQYGVDYVRFGPQSGGMSTGVGNKTKDARLHPSTAAAPHRLTQVTWVAQERPTV